MHDETYLIKSDTLEDIADAIREKKQSQDTIAVSDFANEIENLPSGGSDIDWSAIGYTNTPQAIIDGYNYAVNIKNNWTSPTTLSSAFENDSNLVYMPVVDTSATIDLYRTFYGCINLVRVPELDISNAGTMQQAFEGCNDLVEVPPFTISKISGSSSIKNAFRYCNKLSDTSLDNILQMCISATRYSSTKTLAQLGLNSTYYPVSKIQALPHYQDFINAGWTIGY